MFKPYLNIEILPTYDSRVLVISDNSSWVHLQDEDTFLDITTPGRKTSITREFDKNQITIYNSNTLDLTCATDNSGLTPLPDGIYKFKLYVCDGEQFCEEFYYLRTVNLQVRLDNFLIKHTIDSCNDNYHCEKTYMAVQLLLDAAHAHVRRGNVKHASYSYNEALEIMDDLENCGCDGE